MWRSHVAVAAATARRRGGQATVKTYIRGPSWAPRSSPHGGEPPSTPGIHGPALGISLLAMSAGKVVLVWGLLSLHMHLPTTTASCAAVVGPLIIAIVDHPGRQALLRRRSGCCGALVLLTGARSPRSPVHRLLAPREGGGRPTQRSTDPPGPPIPTPQSSAA